MQSGSYRTALCLLLLLVASVTAASGQKTRGNRPVSAIPIKILLQIIRAEDERHWDNTLPVLLLDKDPKIRKRAALAMGRIGDERALPALIEVLKTEPDNDDAQMIAFAIGEIESPDGAAVLIEILDDTKQPGGVRARAVEALGKIGGALLSNANASADRGNLPKPEDKPLAKIRTVILETLKFEAGRRSAPDRETILLGLTAVLRTRPEGAGPIVVRFLGYSDPRIVADALNALARLRLKDGNEQVRQLLGNGDPIVRANAARVLGATEDKQAFDALLARALNDYDPRVRVSAIRALGSLKDAKSAQPLMSRTENLLLNFRNGGNTGNRRAAKNELLEIVTTLGRILQNSNNAEAIDLLKRFRIFDQLQSPETEIAFARIAPEKYLASEPFVGTNEQIAKLFPRLEKSWRASNTLAQGLAEFANLPPEKKLRSMALMNFALMIEQPYSQDRTIVTAIPSYLRAYAAFKNEVDRPEVLSPNNPNEDVVSRTLRAYVTYRQNRAADAGFIGWREDYRAFGYNDVFVRATAAELLGEQPAGKENAEALATALSQALHFDTQSNEAVLAILGALAKQKSKEANDAIKTALDSSDHLIRRRAVALLKANGVGDFSNRIGTVKTRNTEADYRRAIGRIGKQVTATVVTSKGSFTIEFQQEVAPLTVDNFVQLARKGYFNGITFHRVVPNFVIQGGDPRGDGNGGPGYSIRCEINEVPYERAAVGMALSGKDTGGSQWFVTHAPQPHLDGGYTVFGHVIRGMEVVDSVARGDTIRRVTIIER
jgi:cyclophilin family peptidyl-prolyl cis-trans isomerase/HEAT repeat protein